MKLTVYIKSNLKHILFVTFFYFLASYCIRQAARGLAQRLQRLTSSNAIAIGAIAPLRTNLGPSLLQ